MLVFAGNQHSLANAETVYVQRTILRVQLHTGRDGDVCILLRVRGVIADADFQRLREGSNHFAARLRVDAGQFGKLGAEDCQIALVRANKVDAQKDVMHRRLAASLGSVTERDKASASVREGFDGFDKRLDRMSFHIRE